MLPLIPKEIRVQKQESLLEMVWADSTVDMLPMFFIRCQCPCAACVNEFTGERILDPATVLPNVGIDAAGFAGNYGLKIGWTDGHHSGIYTWERLKHLGELHREELARASLEQAD